MKIVDKLNDIHCKIYTSPKGEGGILAEKLQRESVQALLKGKGTQAWEDYMKNLVDPNIPAQLDRLTGNDANFNALPYAEQTLAYLVANSICGIATATGTKNNLDDLMLESLDKDFSIINSET